MSDRPVDINIEELRELIRLLKESNVSEFELRKADYRLRIKHGMVFEPELTGQTVRQQAPVNGQEPAAGTVETLPQPETTAEPAEVIHEVRSPMVGTFYRSSTPGAAPFVEVGDMVRKGQVLCIIEAMKIMNEIESDVDGEIHKIHIPTGQPVEFSEILFSIKA